MDERDYKAMNNYNQNINQKNKLMNPWICPRCGKVHCPLSMTCDCSPATVLSGSTTQLPIMCRFIPDIKSGTTAPNCICGKPEYMHVMYPMYEGSGLKNVEGILAIKQEWW